MSWNGEVGNVSFFVVEDVVERGLKRQCGIGDVSES